MTNSEAIEYGKEQLEIFGGQHAEFIRMAIEALSNSQKQSESLIRTSADDVSEADVIYRQDAIDIVNRYDKSHMILKGKPMLGAASIVIELEELPSAQRTGEWLRYGEDGNPNKEDTVFWQCDQCLETYTGRTTRIPNYCPNCGADMRGNE